MPKRDLMLKRFSLKDYVWCGDKLKLIGKLLCFLGFHCWQYNCNGNTLDEWEECCRDGCNTERYILRKD